MNIERITNKSITWCGETNTKLGGLKNQAAENFIYP